MKIITKKMLLALSLTLSSQIMALDLNDLTFVAGSSSANYNDLGVPNSVVASNVSSDVLTNVYSLLPEGSSINNDFIGNNISSSIDIDNFLEGATFATVSVTFLNEGAGYRNTLGYFIYPTNNPPQTKDDINEHIVIFPNASKLNSGGKMVEGDTLDLSIQVTAGHTIAFFVIPNGYGWGNSLNYNNLDSLGPWNTPFYTLPSLNPEATAIDRRHNVNFVDTVNDSIIMAFEDLKRPDGDNDFNDLIFSVKVTPFTAVVGVNENGSVDANLIVLAQNNDPNVSMTTVFPASNSWGTLAYEDYWPRKGDYDFNDVVMKYRFTEVVNGAQDVTSINAKLQLQAMGAGYRNGFAIRLPNHSFDNIESVTLTKNGVAVQHNILESNPNETVFVITEDTLKDVEDTGQFSENCKFYRVETACLGAQSVDIEYDLAIEFKTPVSRSDIGQPPYDSFIFATPNTYHGENVGFQPGKAHQTHLKQFSGTSLFDTSLLNTLDDASDETNSFVTSTAFPWALNLTESWAPPVLATDISEAYPQFPTWVTSSGQQNTDWHKSENAVVSKIIQ